MPIPDTNKYKLCVSSTEDDTHLRILSVDGKEVASAVLTESTQGGQALEKLYVVPEHRGQGLSRVLLQAAKQQAAGDLHIKPRPFGDMPRSIQALKTLYAKEGFRSVDGKDNMVYQKTAAKRAKIEGGYYEGDTADPDEVKFTRDFQGIKVAVDRPEGFIMYGRDAQGTPWRRTYQHDYGFIPQTLGGDSDGLDVYIGPNEDAEDAYWVVQLKHDGTFDEYKVFLGFDNEEAAEAAYKEHAPAKLFHGISAMSIEMMKAMLGEDNPQEEVEKIATWSGFAHEFVRIARYT